MAKILIIEDDRAIAIGLEKNLRYEGYEVETVADGEKGLERAVDGKADLIVLDIMLPKVSGFEICETLRKSGIRTPVIYLTAKGQEIDKVMGLNLGGDDYITKPFSVKELLARVRSVLRRAKEPEEKPFRFADVEVDFAGRTVAKGGEEVEITSKEFDLLRFLIRHRGRVLDRDTILKHVWGFDYYGTARTIDNFINRLRQKLENDMERPRHFCTIRGVGYKFVAPSEEVVDAGEGRG